MADDTSRFDTWMSVLTGFGNTARDKVSSLIFLRGSNNVDYRALSDQFEEDDVTASVIGKPVEEIFRVGYEVETGDPDTDKLIRDWVAKYQLDLKISDCMISARLYGGSALYIICEDGNPQDQPLELDSVRQIVGFQELTPKNFGAFEYDEDPLSMTWNRPVTYKLDTGPVIHASRLVIFDGIRVSDQRRRELKGWGASVLRRNDMPIQAYHQMFMSIRALAADLSQGIFRIKGLKDMIARGQEALVMARMELNDMARSSMRALLLDAEQESFDRVSSQIAGIPEFMAKFESRVSSASGIPVTVLFGTSPGGLNATGDSDTRHFYDSLSAHRERFLRPRLELIYQTIFAASNGPTGGVEPEKWDFEFGVFYEPTEKETADTRKVYADIDAIYINAGVVMPQEVALSRFAGGDWSYGMQIEEDSRNDPAGTDSLQVQDPTTNQGDPNLLENPQDPQSGRTPALSTGPRA